MRCELRLWSDSTTALTLIEAPSHILKSFVSNSEYNPADMVSRGFDVRSFASSKLWWQGPCPSMLIVPSTTTAPNGNDEPNEQ